jgi:hypothetical protein
MGGKNPSRLSPGSIPSILDNATPPCFGVGTACVSSPRSKSKNLQRSTCTVGQNSWERVIGELEKDRLKEDRYLSIRQV